MQSNNSPFTFHCFNLFIEIQLALRITFSLNQQRMRSIPKVNSRVKKFPNEKVFYAKLILVMYC